MKHISDQNITRQKLIYVINSIYNNNNNHQKLKKMSLGINHQLKETSCD